MLEKSISFYTLIDWVREIALLLFPRYQLFFEAIPRKIVDTEGTIKVLLPVYQVPLINTEQMSISIKGKKKERTKKKFFF
jgi:hypothetical protein